MTVCGICGEAIDLWAEPTDRRTDAATGDERTVHRACTKEGVERWCRLGRPYGSPLEASRSSGWSWTDARPVAGPDDAGYWLEIDESGE